MSTSELHDVYTRMLTRLYDIEDQLVRAIPTLREQATNEELRTALDDHRAVTEQQRDRLYSILRAVVGTPTHDHDEAFEKMLSDTQEMAISILDSAVRDVVIIAAAQSVEHLEIAKYTSLIGLAEQLGDDETARDLRTSRNEEETASDALLAIAEGGLVTEGVNETAVTHNTD